MNHELEDLLVFFLVEIVIVFANVLHLVLTEAKGLMDLEVEADTLHEGVLGLLRVLGVLGD